MGETRDPEVTTTKAKHTTKKTTNLEGLQVDEDVVALMNTVQVSI